LQGSALWRALEPGPTKIQAERAAKRTAIFSRKPLSVRAQGIAARSGTRTVERVVGYQVARRTPELGFTKFQAEGAVLGEEAALVWKNEAIFHHLQKIAIFERFFHLKLKQNRYSTPYI
jgi:hypothetical protein